MAHLFFDSSAIIKRYTLESGSPWITTLTATPINHTLYLSEITLAEIGAALAAKHRASGGITKAERDHALALFLSHCQLEYNLLPASRLIIDQAVNLTQTYKLRGYDAVQLATALTTNQVLNSAGLSSLIFVAADDDLLMAAQAQGLGTENPNLHM